MTDVREHRRNPFAVGALTVATDLRLWWRQPLAVALALVAPAVVAVIVSNALGSLPEPDVEWAIVDLDEGAASAAFRDEALGSEDLADIVSSEDLDLKAARHRLADEDVDAVIVLPEGMTEAIGRGDLPDIEVLTPDEYTLGTDLALLVAEEFTLRSWALGPDATNDAAWPLEVDVRSASGRSVDVAEHYAPAIGMFFVMFALGFAAQAQVRARLDGITDRLRSTSSSLGAVVLGHAVTGVVVGGASLVTTLVVMGVVFDTTLGPVHLQLVLILAILFAYAGVGALLAAVARNADEALMLALAVPFLFILASGGFAPPGQSSRPVFAPLVPPTHALDAFAEIGVNGAGFGTIAGSMVVLVAFGAGAAALALWIEGRR